MASTYTPTEALAVCETFIRQMALAAATTTIQLDMVNSFIWIYKIDWPWTQADLTAITMVDNTQDYSLALANADMYRLVHVRINQTNVTPNQQNPLDIAEWLEPNFVEKKSWEAFKTCCWIPSTSKLRLDAAAAITSPVTCTITGEYQKNPTKIVTANLGTALPFPDQYFEVFTEGLLYRLYKVCNDERAGTVVVAKNGNRQYSGQLGVFMEKLQSAAEADDYGNGQAFRFPSDPLGLGRGYWPGTIF
jgi:hypothetical protein